MTKKAKKSVKKTKKPVAAKPAKELAEADLEGVSGGILISSEWIVSSKAVTPADTTNLGNLTNLTGQWLYKK